ncbi:hypothetical protein [Paenarthrobacter sp. NPDC090522]|uniref:hypothetical protein n=1 Tax=Paenarthrobacter sp. NPDC090522 TaxID=3364383 RepID=UPI0038079C74
MTFFEDLPVPPERPRHTQPIPPAWVGPPTDELPGVVPVSWFVHSSNRMALALKSVDVYSTGCVLDLVWTVRRGDQTAGEWREAMDKALTPRGPFQQGLDGLLVGVGYPNGRKVFAGLVEPSLGGGMDGDVTGPVLTPLGGGGSGGNDEFLQGTSRYWLWPLPLDVGTVLVAKWDGLGMPESSVPLPVELFAEAARAARKFWVD